MAVPYRVYYQFAAGSTNPAATLQFGIGVSKRYFKKAVDRNRIKRLSREAYRTQCLPLREQLAAKGSQLFIFAIFTGKALPPFSDCQAAMGQALEKLNRLAAQQP